jgi:ABC-type multidrug transport system fused ATPase/permease subunit
MKNILKLTSYIKDQWRSIALVTFLSLIIGAISAITPLIFKGVVDSVVDATKNPTNTSTKAVGLSLLILAVMYAVSLALQYFNGKISDTIRMQMITQMRNRVFPKVSSLSVDYIERHQPGALMQRINQGIHDFQGWIWEVGGSIISLLTGTIFILVIIYTKSIAMGLLFTIVLPILFLVNLQKIKRTRVNREKATKMFEVFNGAYTESISHLALIKTLSAERHTEDKIIRTSNRLMELRISQYNIWYKINLIRDAIGSSSIVIAIVLASYLAIDGKFTPGDLFVIIFYSRDLVNSIGPLSRFFENTSDVEISAERLVSFLETVPELQDKPDALPLVQLESIEFKNVSFTYPESKKGAVHNLSFRIEGDKTLALVGPSGTGKSTITKLLLRFYGPTSGEILINGRDIGDFTQESIRQHMGVVMQDVALFNTTIEENLAIANPRMNKDGVRLAAKQAHADEFIQELPKKYKTLVGERGIKLSGGQKQRVAIARAILKNPQLIILDEATSALDSESERLVQDGLKKLMAGRSALVIAHRLSTIMHADEILVLKNGKVAERGTHSELINQTGLYKKLFNLQSSSGKVKL